MTTITISVAEEFSPCPAGRIQEDGPFPGEIFREKLLLPAMKANNKVIVDMVGTELAGSSFLEEAFGGLIRAGFTEKSLKAKLFLNSPRQSDPIRIWRFIHEEAIRSNRLQ